MAPLERVAWLEQENAALRAEIARLDAHAALEETVHTRPREKRTSMAVAALMFVVVLATVLAPLVLIAVTYQARGIP